MKTLEDHNNEAYERYSASTYAVKAGVACPKCQTEMELHGDPNMVLACWPPKRTVICPNCGHLDYKVS